MSSGVLLQLAAYGNQNINLTGNPEISLFKTIYKRHTEFAMNDMVNPFTGNAKLGQINKVIINKSGDLLSDMHLNLRVKITEEEDIDYSFINNLGYNIIDYVELYIGQTRVDRQYGEWLNIYQELAKKNYTQNSYKNIMDAPNELLVMKTGTSNTVTHTIELFIPLEFWFCKYSNVPLPLLSLQHDEIYLNIKFKEAKYLVNRGYIHSGSVSNTLLPSLDSNNCQLITNQLLLHNDERKFFVNTELTYLIEQVQDKRDNSITATDLETVNTYQLTFNHPVKALFWVITQDIHTNLAENNNHMLNLHKSNSDSNTNIIQENIFAHIVLNYFVQEALESTHSFTTNDEYRLTVDSSYRIFIHDFHTKVNEIQVGKFNVNYRLDNEHIIKDWHYKKLDKIFNKIKLTVSAGTTPNSLTTDNIHFDTLTENDEYFLRHILNNTHDAIKATSSTSSTSVFESVFPISDNATNVSTTLNHYINHNFNINSLHPKTDINPTKSARLLFNGLSRTANLSGKYYNHVQPLKHNLNSPHTGINMYSFSLNPFGYQPTGHCNFSKLDKVDLEITQNKSLTTGKVNIYALNYNILKIKNGVGGLAYTS